MGDYRFPCRFLGLGKLLCEEIRMVDVALLPEFRGAGVGTALTRELLEEGAKKGKPVRLRVWRENPALRLYQRLGFKVERDEGIYLALEWRAEA